MAELKLAFVPVRAAVAVAQDSEGPLRLLDPLPVQDGVVHVIELRVASEVKGPRLDFGSEMHDGRPAAVLAVQVHSPRVWKL